MTTVTALTADHIAAYRVLRVESLRDAPSAFSAAPDDDQATAPEQLRQQLARGPSWMLFGAFDDGRMVGAVGLLRETRRKAAHKAQLWGMYVTPSHRKRGVASMLLDAAITHARQHGIEWLQLGVTTAEAQRLYERIGFVTWGIERDALRYEGRSFDEARMALRV